MGASSKVRHSLGEVTQGLLLDHLASRTKPVIGGPGGGELAALFQIAGRASASGPPPGLLFDGQVPYISCLRTVATQYLLLDGRRKEPVTEHTNTLANTTDISRRGGATFPAGLEAMILKSLAA
jgi:hypothetical protein